MPAPVRSSRAPTSGLAFLKDCQQFFVGHGLHIARRAPHRFAHLGIHGGPAHGAVQQFARSRQPHLFAAVAHQVDQRRYGLGGVRVRQRAHTSRVTSTKYPYRSLRAGIGHERSLSPDC